MFHRPSRFYREFVVGTLLAFKVVPPLARSFTVEIVPSHWRKTACFPLGPFTVSDLSLRHGRE
jgi:hypothetical protein